ncbi:glycosyltransferase [uncultured Clostridium sp.]|uniref:glycosyltransferase n=1 Tax=uncultured Clostridium sp. TaxID=59620 RepID=UPI00261D8F77|nr:glycosyltransferase [uncultured Clostridium sp.]
MNGIRLSLCIISKNEEKMIENAILSGKKIADEIIVLDTGSKDRTKEIATLGGAKVYETEFFYDFSDLRNKCIEKATGDFILFLDCDERIENPEKIRTVLKNIDSEVAVSLRVCSYLDSIKRSEENIIRLFKRDERIRYRGRIQETVKDTIRENFGEEGILYTDIKISHFGSDEKVVNVKEKLSRNLKVFSMISEEEKDSKYHFDLGNEYGRMGNFEMALEQYDKSLDKIDKNDDELKVRTVLNKVKAMHKLEVYEEELEFIKEHILEFEDFRDLYFLKCLCEIQLGQFHAAKDSLEDYIRREKLIKYPSSEFESAMDLEKFYRNIEKISRTINL